MQLTGKQEIRRERAGVWAALNEPAVLKQCIPGCEALEANGEHSYRIVLMAAVGPVKARFTGKLSLTDIRPGEGYALTFEGSGGAAGFGKGGAKVSLADAAGGTLLAYEAEARVGGKLAQVGARLIDGVAAKMADDFFARFKQVVEQPEPAVQAVPAAAPAPTAPVAPAEAPRTSAPAYRRAGLALLGVTVVALAWYFSTGH